MSEKHTHKVILQEPNVNLFCISYIHTGFHFPWIKNFLGMSFGESFCEYKNDKISWGVNLGRWNKLGELILKKLKDKSLEYNILKKESQRVGRETIILTDELLKKNLSELSKESLSSYIKKLHQLSAELSCYGFIPVASDFYHFLLSSEIKKIIQARIKDKTLVNDYVQKLISHTEESFSEDENKSILQITTVIKDKISYNNKLVKDLIKEHKRKFCWLTYGYQGPAMTEEYYISEIKQTLTNNKSLSDQIKSITSSRKDLRKKQKELVKSLNLNSDELYIIDAARAFLYLKSYRMEIRHKSNYVCDLLLEEISKRSKVSIRELRYCTPEEIEQIIKDGEKPSELKDRLHYCVYVIKDSNKLILTGIKAKIYLTDILMKEETLTDISRIHGQAASLGLARGYAKIVKSISDIYKVNDGDILVAIETVPDYIPAMKKAAAFVTEQGGITSHASIVAREMKKPCLIGTKIATKVFKDGDYLEVNVNEGYVARLENKN